MGDFFIYISSKTFKIHRSQFKIVFSFNSKCNYSKQYKRYLLKALPKYMYLKCKEKPKCTSTSIEDIATDEKRGVSYCKFWIYWVSVNAKFTSCCHIYTHPANSKFTIWQGSEIWLTPLEVHTRSELHGERLCSSSEIRLRVCNVKQSLCMQNSRKKMNTYNEFLFLKTNKRYNNFVWELYIKKLISIWGKRK